jgi:hypothetical protein
MTILALTASAIMALLGTMHLCRFLSAIHQAFTNRS